MDPIKITLVLSIFVALSLAICWLDYKKSWQLNDWIHGRCSNPFKHNGKSPKSEGDKDALIQQLTERVQVLEKIVTEPSYELNKKLNQL
jgi:protein-arginine kinase activator protein McsA